MVESVGLRITTLRDVNGTVWYVRNGEVVRVGNKSQGFAVAVVDVPLSRLRCLRGRVLGLPLEEGWADGPVGVHRRGREVFLRLP